MWVCFAITIEPSAPLPKFLLKRGLEFKVFKAATEVLWNFVMSADGSISSVSVLKHGESPDCLIESVVAFAEDKVHQVIPHVGLF